MLLLSIKICIFEYMIKWNMIVNKFEIRYIILYLRFIDLTKTLLYELLRRFLYTHIVI